jgi:hypothetical protein
MSFFNNDGYPCLIVRYLEYDRMEHKSMKLISSEHDARDLDWFRISIE